MTKKQLKRKNEEARALAWLKPIHDNAWQAMLDYTYMSDMLRIGKFGAKKPSLDDYDNDLK